MRIHGYSIFHYLQKKKKINIKISCCKEDYRTYICAYLQTFYMEGLQYDTHSEKKNTPSHLGISCMQSICIKCMLYVLHTR